MSQLFARPALWVGGVIAAVTGVVGGYALGHRPDSRSTEPMAEIFLPADMANWRDARQRLPGAIVDTEIGGWLKDITDKKAYVWAVFDCCHSETMDRDWNLVEVAREIPPTDLGVPAGELEAA